MILKVSSYIFKIASEFSFGEYKFFGGMFRSHWASTIVNNLTKIIFTNCEVVITCNGENFMHRIAKIAKISLFASSSVVAS